MSTHIRKLHGYPLRPEFEKELEPLGDLSVERALPLVERLGQHAWLRKIVILLLIALVWEVVARVQNNDLLLPGMRYRAAALVL